MDSQLEALLELDWPVLGDAVGHMDQPDGAEWKMSVGHQGEVQRERKHVRIGRRQLLARENPHTRA